ncbi:MAG: dockerin type I repeat-containing protein [Clostridia bacterium]|nr:dockerin type I repeat-containing protein [Clostridia bacterium]
MKRSVISCFMGILCVFMLFFGRAAQGVEVFRDNGSGVVRMFAQVNGTPLAVITSGGSTYFATPGGSFAVGSACDRAVNCNGVLVLLSSNGGSTQVSLAGSGGVYAEFSVPQPVGAVRGYAFAGDFFWCCVGKELQVYDASGALVKKYSLPAAADSLAVTSGGRVLAFCNDGVVYAADGLPEELTGLYSGGVHPMVPLGGNYFVDAYGNFCVYGGDGVYYTGVTGTPPRTTDYAASAVNGEVAMYASSGSEVTFCSLATGETLGTAAVSGNIKAMAGGAALVYDGGTYAIVFPEYSVPTPVPMPTPEPEPTPNISATPVPTASPMRSPSPSPVSSGEEAVSSAANGLPAGVRVLDDQLLVPVGTTAAQLRKAEEIEEVLTADGKRADGACRTGMDARCVDGSVRVIVVPGDNNWSGTVNTADITALQKHILGEAQLQGVSFAAADLDENGMLNTADLVLLAAVLSGINDA